MSRPSKDIRAEYITITELSKLVSKSPQSIYKKMKQKPSFNQYIRVFDGKKYVHKTAVWEEFGVAVEGCEPDESKGLENPQPDSPLVSVLTDQVQTQKQQIENMQRTIDSLTEALRAEQLLRASADKRIAALLEDMQNREQATGKPDSETEQEQATGTPADEAAQGQTTEAPDREPEHIDGTPFDEDQEQTQQKPPTFLDRIMKALGLR